MTVTTRPATPADAAAIQRLNRDDLGYDHPLDAVVAALADALTSPRDLVMVAEVDGDVGGDLLAVSREHDAAADELEL